jgi:excisionase family DNA binding protein
MNALMDIETARQELGGISRSRMFQLLKSGELRSVKIGRRRLVPSEAITEYIGSLESQASAGYTNDE